MLVKNNLDQVKKKINILFFIDYLHGFGGTERFLFNLTTRLNRSLFNCLVCPFRFNRYAVKIFRDAGIHVELTPLRRIYGISAFKQASRILRLIRKHNIHVVQTFNIDSDIYGTLVAKLSGVPVIISSRRDLGTYRKKRHLMVSKVTNRYISHFLAVCDAVAKNLSERERIESRQITTIYNGFDLADLDNVDQGKVTELRRRLNIGRNSFVMGNVSHFRPEKGYHIFFEAVRKVKPSIPNLHVIAVGAGEPLLGEFKKEIEREGLEDFVFLAGYAPNVFNYLSLMDICCLTPVSNEGFSNTLLEQMAMGKPIIATDVGGNREAIVHGESGLIIPPNDVNALVDGMMNLYRNRTLRKSLGENAKKRVASEFAIEKMIEQIEQFYLKIYQKNCNGKVNLTSEAIAALQSETLSSVIQSNLIGR